MTAGKRRKKSHLWARHPDDYYVEQPWVTAALLAKVKFEGTIVDPCCGRGNILDAAAEAGFDTFGFDIVDRGASKRHAFMLRNFFQDEHPVPLVDVICNPPYKYDDEFVARVVAMTQRRCAILLRAQWANGDRRSRWLETLPLRYVLPITPRPSMPPGTVIDAGEKPGNGETDFTWFVFERGYVGAPEFGWARRLPRPAITTAAGRSRHENKRKKEKKEEGGTGAPPLSRSG